MSDRPRPRVVLIDDQGLFRAGFAHVATELEVIASFPTVEAFLGSTPRGYDAVLLDLQLDGPGVSAPDGRTPLIGTAAIAALLDAGHEPVVLCTSVAEDMVIAGCLAAGAMGAVTKNAPVATVTEVVRHAMSGRMWVDPLVAGALHRLANNLHAGALSPQQASALTLRAQGLKQRAIAARIGVQDEETVHRYLKAAVDKLSHELRRLAGASSAAAADDDHAPAARMDELARRSGLASGLVRWQDIDAERRRRRRSKRGR